MPNIFQIVANRVDVISGTISAATIEVNNGIIRSITAAAQSANRGFLIPGFVDSHIHIESSMLLPSQFARAAVVHGTVATVSDPHEIANVCGLDGIELMLRDAAQSPFKFHFGAPACVPATKFETAGAELNVAAVQQLLNDPRIGYLAEMMDFPGVLSGDTEVLAKIAAAKQLDKPVDGHAPGLRGEEARRYVAAGITTDHECFTMDEALDKLNAGCKIAIREGSAARNFDALWPLIDRYPDDCLLCSDDKHPDELMLGHINELVQRAVANGCDPMNVLRVASRNPVQHYGLNVGLLQEGDPADFVLVEDLESFSVRRTYIGGERVAESGKSLMPAAPIETINQFAATPIFTSELAIPAEGNRVRVIQVIDGQLITESEVADAKIDNGYVVSDIDHDILKLVVVNRYEPAKPAVALVRGFGLKGGALASTVAHDSHNVLAVGTSDTALCRAINAVIDTQGGLSAAVGTEVDMLPLPVGGLMAAGSCEEVAAVYSRLDGRVKSLGCQLRAPYMTLSFLTLLVIPSLKLSDKGLFDVDRFEFASLFVS